MPSLTFLGEKSQFYPTTISLSYECSTLAFPQRGLAGQNWDWAKPIVSLLAIHKVETGDGKRFVSLSEPGMLAKIGLNHCGLAVCLNILPADTRLNGLPVHILLRALPESTDLNSAHQLITQHGKGKASHILVADRHSAFGAELSASSVDILSNETVYSHTNHYL